MMKNIYTVSFHAADFASHGCFLISVPENVSSLRYDGKAMSNDAISFHLYYILLPSYEQQHLLQEAVTFQFKHTLILSELRAISFHFLNNKKSKYLLHSYSTKILKLQNMIIAFTGLSVSKMFLWEVLTCVADVIVTTRP
jgi:hypothetical protein